MLLCEDLLMVCDKLVVASSTISKGVEREIALAELLGMEVEYLETE
jgi:hypothetical protein